jgi:hypothetical protein
VSEERDIHTDYNGCHHHSVKHASYLSVHFSTQMVSRDLVPMWERMRQPGGHLQAATPRGSSEPNPKRRSYSAHAGDWTDLLRILEGWRPQRAALM